MTDPQTLRDAFRRKRYGPGKYDPDFDLFDAAADEIERLRAALTEIREMADTAYGGVNAMVLIDIIDAANGQSSDL